MTIKKWLFALAATILAIPATAQDAQPMTDLDIIQAYAEDFTQDPFLTEPMQFGVEVGEDFYTVNVSPAGENIAGTATVVPGNPDTPLFYFTVRDSAYLQRVYNGEFNVLTLMAKAFSTDVTVMDIETQDGFEPPEDFGANILPLTFHFWTRGNPIYVPFGRGMTQQTHGTNAGIFYYQPGFRSGWFDIQPGDHVNADENSRTNPFPSMMIMLEGEVTAQIGDDRSTFQQGNMLFIPAGVSHQFFNEGDTSALGILLMFGEGA